MLLLGLLKPFLKDVLPALPAEDRGGRSVAPTVAHVAFELEPGRFSSTCVWKKGPSAAARDSSATRRESQLLLTEVRHPCHESYPRCCSRTGRCWGWRRGVRPSSPSRHLAAIGELQLRWTVKQSIAAFAHMCNYISLLWFENLFFHGPLVSLQVCVQHRTRSTVFGLITCVESFMLFRMVVVWHMDEAVDLRKYEKSF